MAQQSKHYKRHLVKTFPSTLGIQTSTTHASNPTSNWLLVLYIFLEYIYANVHTCEYKCFLPTIHFLQNDVHTYITLVKIFYRLSVSEYIEGGLIFLLR
jgi:hypothetical protein